MPPAHPSLHKPANEPRPRRDRWRVLQKCRAGNNYSPLLPGTAGVHPCWPHAVGQGPHTAPRCGCRSLGWPHASGAGAPQNPALWCRSLGLAVGAGALRGPVPRVHKPRLVPHDGCRSLQWPCAVGAGVLSSPALWVQEPHRAQDLHNPMLWVQEPHAAPCYGCKSYARPWADPILWVQESPPAPRYGCRSPTEPETCPAPCDGCRSPAQPHATGAKVMHSPMPWAQDPRVAPCHGCRSPGWPYATGAGVWAGPTLGGAGMWGDLRRWVQEPRLPPRKTSTAAHPDGQLCPKAPTGASGEGGTWGHGGLSRFSIRSTSGGPSPAAGSGGREGGSAEPSLPLQPFLVSKGRRHEAGSRRRRCPSVISNPRWPHAMGR